MTTQGDPPRAPTLIRDLPAPDRPRERLRDAGPAALSNQELLAILLRTGAAGENALAVANRLLTDFGGLAGLWRCSFAELCGQRHIGEAKAAQLKAALELGVRMAQAATDERREVSAPDDLAKLMLTEMSLLDQEQVRVVLLDSRNRIMSINTTYQGSPHAVHVRVGDLFADAVRDKAVGIVLVHNHPSGEPAPSAEDILLTRRMCDAAKLMDIELLDHLVIGGGRYVSMRAANVGFPPKVPQPPRAAPAASST